jgi:hypothetical protein
MGVSSYILSDRNNSPVRQVTWRGQEQKTAKGLEVKLLSKLHSGLFQKRILNLMK